jgi:hypothetical protein
LFSPDFREGGGSELIRYGSSPQDDALLIGEWDKNIPFSTHFKTIKPRKMPVERFLSMLRFDNGGELDDLGFEIDPNTLKSSELRPPPAEGGQAFGD